MTPAEFNAKLLDPIYARIGVPARLITGSGVPPIDVTVIDKTEGIAVTESAFQTETIRPAACVRLSELAAKAVKVAAVGDGQLVLDPGTPQEKTWRIKAPREQRGEAFLILLDEAGV